MRRVYTIFASLLLLGSVPSWSQQDAQIQSLVRSGKAALDAGDLGRASADFEKARQVAPDNLEVNRGLLLTYLEAGRLREAETLGSDAAARWPQDAQIQHWLGLVYFKTGRTELALEALNRSEKLDGSHSDIHFDTGLCVLETKQYSPAPD